MQISQISYKSQSISSEQTYAQGHRYKQRVAQPVQDQVSQTKQHTSRSPIRTLRVCCAAAVKEKSAKKKKEPKQNNVMINILKEYEPVIGIETHIQLNSKTKAFCRCANVYGSPPNTNVCPKCLGHPGTLPVLNGEVPMKGIQLATALKCKINLMSTFDRKQYFYPDLPKGYQISQFDLPLCEDGYVEVPIGTEFKKVGIERAHLEEDSGKLTHSGGQAINLSASSVADYNRAGVPLMEVVSKPDMRSGLEAILYGQELRRICNYINASEANMEEGQLRCDVNISIRKIGAEDFGTRVEIKNINSFSGMQKAIDFEIERQANLISDNKIHEIVMETRTWDEKSQKTISMRKKEGLADYRYFPEPDLPPLKLSQDYISQIQKQMSVLPDVKRKQYVDMGIKMEDILVISDQKQISQYFDEAIEKGADIKQAINWIIGDIMALVNDQQIGFNKINLRPSALAEMIQMIQKETISGKIGKSLIKDIIQGDKQVFQVKEMIDQKGLSLINDPVEIENIVQQVINNSQEQVQAYKAGKTKIIGYFNGEIMKQSQGRINPKDMNKILTQLLNKQ